MLDDNETDYECVRVHDWNPDLPPPNITLTSQPVCFSTASARKRRGCVDSGANVNMSPFTEHVLSYTGDETEVTGMSGSSQSCPNVTLGIPTVTADGEPLLLELPGPSLLHTGANGILLAHSLLQKAGFTVKLRSGTRHNSHDGGFIRIPDGRVVRLRFENDLYYLPVHTPARRANHSRSHHPTPAPLPSPNPYHLLGEDEGEVLTCRWTQADIETSHNAWCHPGASKTDAIIAHYPDLFPKDPKYRAAARQHQCPVCDLMKGSRKYRKSKRMKNKRDKKDAKHAKSCVLRSVKLPALSSEPVGVCASHREPSPDLPRRVRFAPEVSTRSRLSADDFLNAFQARSHLVMVIDGVDFLWASPSKHKSDLESLLEEFIRYTQIKISKIRMDAAGEFASSESFQQWCSNRGIVICSTAGYNHTMQARAEGAVRITKEHIRCMLKTANMPFQFWPWALTQFCRMYNYWPCKGHAPPWVMLGKHNFSQDITRDLHPFGCKVVGKLPREHPQVPNTTLSDRGLEGAFLGWDLSTPTVWLWSFRLKRPVRLHDPIFYDGKFPFDDPSCQRCDGRRYGE